MEDNNSTQHQNEVRSHLTETIRKTGTIAATKQIHNEKLDETYEIMKNIKDNEGQR